MKTYELVRRRYNGERDCGFDEKFILRPDPKREGMYKMSRSYSTDGFKREWSELYGKCNQEYIQKSLKEENWIEVA